LSDFYALSDALPPAEALPKRGSTRNRRCGWILICRPAMFPSRSLFYGDWNWPAADQEFKRAIALAPGLAGRIAGTQFI